MKQKKYFNNYILDFVKKEGEEKETLNKLKPTLEKMYEKAYREDDRIRAGSLK